MLHGFKSTQNRVRKKKQKLEMLYIKHILAFSMP